MGTPASASLKLGREGTTTAGSIDSRMDDVRIYNRALSGPEVAALYQYGACAQ
jgi:hypothetical protein